VVIARAELVRGDAEVVGQLELGLRLPGYSEEVVDRFVADRELAPLLETQGFVEAIDRSGSVTG